MTDRSGNWKITQWGTNTYGLFM